MGGRRNYGHTGWVRHAHVELRLLILAGLASRHLAGEDAGRDRVDADLGVDERRREQAAQVQEARFGGRVRELAG